MSGEANVELVRQGFESLRKDGVEGLLPFIHPDFEVTTPPELVAEPDTYRGPEGIRRYFESFYEAMDEVSFEPEKFVAVGELVVVKLVLRARGRTTGIETEQSSAGVWELRDGLTVRLEVFGTWEEALAAARREVESQAQTPRSDRAT